MALRRGKCGECDAEYYPGIIASSEAGPRQGALTLLINHNGV
jgi:hypothetical protein